MLLASTTTLLYAACVLLTRQASCALHDVQMSVPVSRALSIRTPKPNDAITSHCTYKTLTASTKPRHYIELVLYNSEGWSRRCKPPLDIAIRHHCQVKTEKGLAMIVNRRGKSCFLRFMATVDPRCVTDALMCVGGVKAGVPVCTRMLPTPRL